MPHYFDAAHREEIETLRQRLTARRWQTLNKVLGYAPFAVWYPYTLYRDSHLLHHRDEDLAVPGRDPESRYLSAEQWQRSSLFEQDLHWLNKTVLGRFVLGAPLALLALAREELQRAYRARREQWRARSGGFLVQGYARLIRQLGVRAIDCPRHPFH